MRAVVIYESMFGNTKAIADAIAAGLRSGGEVELVEVGNAPTTIDPAIDLVVLGGPTHAFGMTRSSTREDAVRQGAPVTGNGIREWIEGLAGAPGGAGFVTFDTRVGKPRFPGSAARSAQRHLRKRGCRLAARPMSFWVDGTKGPLVDGEVDRARAWGAALAGGQRARTASAA